MFPRSAWLQLMEGRPIENREPLIDNTHWQRPVWRITSLFYERMNHCRPYGEDMLWPYWEGIFSDGGPGGALGLAYSANITHPSRNCKRQRNHFPKRIVKRRTSTSTMRESIILLLFLAEGIHNDIEIRKLGNNIIKTRKIMVKKAKKKVFTNKPASLYKMTQHYYICLNKEPYIQIIDETPNFNQRLQSNIQKWKGTGRQWNGFNNINHLLPLSYIYFKNQRVYSKLYPCVLPLQQGINIP